MALENVTAAEGITTQHTHVWAVTGVTKHVTLPARTKSVIAHDSPGTERDGESHRCLA